MPEKRIRDPGRADRHQEKSHEAIVTGRIAVGARLGETPIARPFGEPGTSVREPLTAHEVLVRQRRERATSWQARCFER